ncbi:hypothetical protein IW261DRAFT_1519787 [Armillaria novae-zelandiae]|uniref:Secreted protein n=1 Tax=Armillaria novae-zelandiae TaxID=153914 RepID=A0AA39NKW1_9AGAR|nr:hypothetical protein IW261DRAFT_1519787 [Armillaria novae-zelandiae]
MLGSCSCLLSFLTSSPVSILVELLNSVQVLCKTVRTRWAFRTCHLAITTNRVVHLHWLTLIPDHRVWSKVQRIYAFWRSSNST